MGATTRTIGDIDAAVWKAAEAYAEAHQTTMATLLTEALVRYLEDEVDLEIAEAARAEGGRIPYDLGRRLLLAESDAEAERAQAEIDAYELASRR